MADHLPAHVAHVHRRNESLEAKIRRLKDKAAHAAEHGVRTVEVIAGAGLGGLIQGMAKDPSVGAKIFHVPADLAIGASLKLCGLLELAGEEYSDHLANFGDGFLGAYFSDLGFSIGAKRKATGSFFGPKNTAALPPGPPPGLPVAAPAQAVAAGDPQALAAQLLQQMQR